MDDRTPPIKALLTGTLVVALGFAMTTAAHAAYGKAHRYQFLRWKEDWTHLRNASPAVKQSDFWNRIKYIPAGENYVSFGGHMRARYERWRDFAFATANDDNFIYWRLLGHADFHFDNGARFYIEGKSALMTNRSLPGGARTLDVDTLALQQMFIDIPAGEHFLIRPGRQMLSFGRQRLVSPFSWANTLRTWDGITVVWQPGAYKITGFTTRFVPVRSYDFNRPNVGYKFSGFYVNGPLPGTRSSWDLYWFYSDNNAAAFDRLAGVDRRHTLGTRLAGNLWEGHIAPYDFEIAYQGGNFIGNRNLDINAYMLAAEAGYQFREVRTAPTLNVGFDYGSGGNPATSRELKTFNQLFPQGHEFLGYIDTIGRQNIVDVHGGVSLRPIRKMKIGANYHVFTRANNFDGVYNAIGGVVAAGNRSSAAKIGNELDFVMKFACSKHIKTMLGYSVFKTGSFLSQAGLGNNTNFGYLSVKYIV